MLTQEQRREIVAVGLLAVALSFLLSLLPVSLFGGRGAAWFPSGNILAAAGGAIRGILTAFVGGTAILVPLLLTVAGLRAGDWLSQERSVRFALLLGGLTLLLPPALWVVVGTPTAAGWLGETLGSPLIGLLGRFGALLVSAVGLVALSVATVGWNPIRSVGKGVMVGGDVAGRTAKALADKGKEIAEARAQAAVRREEAEAETALAEPMAGFEPEWLDSDEEGEEDLDAHEREDGEAVDDDESSGEDEERAGPFEAEGDRAADELADPNAGSPIEHEVPPVDLLSAPHQPDRESMDRQLDELGKVLIEKLRTFNVESRLRGRTTGPMVTQFEVVPAPGVKVNRIANLDADLALAMKARTIRIVAPIPGKGAVGVEIPNPRPEIVNLREILETPAFRKAKGELPLALGKDLNGRPYVSALERMPHVLIAGATGAGKSVCLNTIVTSLVYRHTPETLRLLMIDPKMVELSVYSRLPHLRHNVVDRPPGRSRCTEVGGVGNGVALQPPEGELRSLHPGVQQEGSGRRGAQAGRAQGA